MIWKWFAPIILGTLEYDFKGLIDDPSIATFRVGYGASVRIYPSNRAKLTTGQATARCLTGVGERSDTALPSFVRLLTDYGRASKLGASTTR